MISDTLVVNLFSGPGTGKSTVAAEVFSKMKWAGINCEYAPEYAKDVVWEKAYSLLDFQIHIFGQQHHRINRLLGKVDVVITDSPLLLSLVYGTKETPEFRAFVLAEFNKMNNLNYFLIREKPWNPRGRTQTEARARGIDTEVLTMLDSNSIQYKSLQCRPSDTGDLILEDIKALVVE